MKLRENRSAESGREAPANEKLVEILFEGFLQRRPTQEQLKRWVAELCAGLDPRQMVMRLARSQEYQAKRRLRASHPAGHFYSPIVDPEQAAKYVQFGARVEPGQLKGLQYPVEQMIAFWREHTELLAQCSFPQFKMQNVRYYWDNKIFPASDAAILRAIILRSRPSRIIEIGSGFSTACMLDALDEIPSIQCKVICIEPHPQRLFGLLKQSDLMQLSIVQRPVQEVQLDMFADLCPGDILFIDSTHVLKTGSDVQYELFDILPALRAGVLIHFHDIHYPFEYPKEWIFENKYSWNEIYALRAFLMFNNVFQVIFHGSYFAGWHEQLVRDVYPLFLRNPGGSLWLKKTR